MAEIDTNIGVNTAEFDAKIKAASEKAKKNLSDISKGLRVAGPAISGFGARLKNLSSVGFAGLMAAGVGVLIAGFKKATSLANEMLKGALEDAKAINEDLQRSMAFQNKDLDDAQAALKIIADANEKGIRSAEQAETVRQAIRTVDSRLEGSSGIYVLKGKDGRYTLDGSFSDYTENAVAKQLYDKQIENTEAELESLKRLQAQTKYTAEELRNSRTARVDPSTSDEATRLFHEANILADKVKETSRRLERLKIARDDAPRGVAARAEDRANKDVAVAEAEAQAKAAMRALTAVRATQAQQAQAVPGQTKAQAAASTQTLAAQAKVQAQAASQALKDALKAQEKSGGSRDAKTAVEVARNAEAQVRKITDALEREAKKQQLSLLNQQKTDLKDEIKGTRLQSQTFTNNLTRRGGFQSGGMLWSNDRYQQQMTARVQTISTQLQTLIRNINQINTTP